MFNFSTVSIPATRQQRASLRGVSALLPVVALLAAASLMTLQPVGAQVPQSLSQQTASIDPPGRVARMNLAEGPVSYAPADSGGDPRWTPASLNRPLTTGDRLWTGQRARSELHIGSTAVRLGEQTSLDFLELDDDTTQLRLAQGTMKLRVRNLYDGQRLEINTPNLAFLITQPGDYRIDTHPASNLSAGATRVVVQQGAGTIYGDGGASVNIASGQQANFTDTQLTPAGLAPEVQDSFDAWALQRDRLEDQSVSARYVPREVVGYQQLDNYGDWNQDPTYGAVWLPRAVPVNWAPYRDGHWSWIAPWGWTWVDDAPWGFAPFHYGRWAQIGPRWGWVPGRLAPRPVYAPALVAFIGGNAGGVNWNVAIGQQGPRPGLGWFPLAPGEAFRPAYRHSPRYVTNVNHNIVVNNVNVTNNYRYQRQGNAVSAMSAEDFARGQRVRPEGQRLNAADLGRARVIAPERGGLPQRLADLRDLPRAASPAALPPAAVAVRPVVTSQGPQPGRRDDRREDRQHDPQGNARAGRPGESLGQQPSRPGQVVPPAPPQQGAAPDRGAFEAEQRVRAEQQRQQQERLQGQQIQREQERQQRDLARQQQDRAGGQRQPGDESLVQRALREQAQRNGNVNGNPGAAVSPVQQGRPDAGRDPIEQAQREQQRLQREQQRQPIDAARQQEPQRRQADESIGQRALQEQAQRQQQAQRQAQEQQAQQAQQATQRAQQDQARQLQAAEQQRAQQDQQRQAQQQQQQLMQQQRAQQDQQRQAREQQQQQQEQQQSQRQQQDQARQAAQQQAAQQQVQRQQTQEHQAQQAQQRAQQDQARQQQMAQQQQQQQQLQQRAQQEQQRQAREQQQQQTQQQPQRQQPDQPRGAGRERQPRPGEAVNGALVEERGNRRRD